MGSRLAPTAGSEQIKEGQDVSDIKGTLSQGVDNDGKASPLSMTGADGKFLRVAELNGHLLEQILLQLKINNAILNEVHDSHVNEQDVK